MFDYDLLFIGLLLFLVLKGDLDGDGDIDCMDFILIMCVIFIRKLFDVVNDINGDGVVNIVDGLLLCCSCICVCCVVR